MVSEEETEGVSMGYVGRSPWCDTFMVNGGMILPRHAEINS